MPGVGGAVGLGGEPERIVTEQVPGRFWTQKTGDDPSVPGPQEWGATSLTSLLEEAVQFLARLDGVGLHIDTEGDGTDVCVCDGEQPVGTVPNGTLQTVLGKAQSLQQLLVTPQSSDDGSVGMTETDFLDS